MDIDTVFDQPGYVKDFLLCILKSYMPYGRIPTMHDFRTVRTILRYNIYSQILINSSDAEYINEKSKQFHQKIYAALIHNSITNRHTHFGDDINTVEKYGAYKEMLDRLWSLLHFIQNNGIEINQIRMVQTSALYSKYLNVVLEPFDPTQLPLSGNEIKRFRTAFPKALNPGNVFQVRKQEWDENFLSGIGNHHYLFHTTHLKKMVGILREGLLVAPDHQYSYNRWSGVGIYLHGCIGAAERYAKRLRNDVLLICRVALGNPKIIHNFTCIEPNNKIALEDTENSIKVLGRAYQTNFEWSEKHQASLSSDVRSYYGSYDEYVVQNANQIKIEYIIKLENQ